MEWFIIGAVVLWIISRARSEKIFVSSIVSGKKAKIEQALLSAVSDSPVPDLKGTPEERLNVLQDMLWIASSEFDKALEQNADTIPSMAKMVRAAYLIFKFEQDPQFNFEAVQKSKRILNSALLRLK
jgi:hypothetical protein